LNIEYSENKGLEAIFTDLNMFYEQTTEFSRADFWALFAIRTLRFVNPRDSTVKPENYTFGRIDCETSPYESELYDYPNPRKGWSHVYEKFGPAHSGRILYKGGNDSQNPFFCVFSTWDIYPDHLQVFLSKK